MLANLRKIYNRDDGIGLRNMDLNISNVKVVLIVVENKVPRANRYICMP